MADLEVSYENGIATLTMNRPEARNALSMEMRSALADVLHDIEQDSSLRCVVLQGAGQHFMAGGDVKGMGESVKKTPEEIRKEFILRIHDLHPIMFAMRRMPKPIIASCRGAAAGLVSVWPWHAISSSPPKTRSSRWPTARSEPARTALPASICPERSESRKPWKSRCWAIVSARRKPRTSA